MPVTHLLSVNGDWEAKTSKVVPERLGKRHNENGNGIARAWARR